jgi:heme/copper-type cytochrome/quinol oxidase subunit 2
MSDRRHGAGALGQRRLARWLGAATLLTLVFSALPATAQDDPPPEGAPVEPRVIKMDAENWKWVPNQIRVKQGNRVVLDITSRDAPHRFDLKAYGLKVPLPQDQTTRVEFVADKAGEFRWRCGRPCGDGCPKMTGTLTVFPVQANEPD